MTPVSYVLTLTKTRLQAATIPGIKTDQIDIYTSKSRPPDIGEKSLFITPLSKRSLHPEHNWRPCIIAFQVHLIERIRQRPEQSRGRIYTETKELHEIHDAIEDVIVSLEMFVALNTLITTTEAANSSQKKFSLSNTFTHAITSYTPALLYPGWFMAQPSAPTDQVAGYRTFGTYRSPEFFPSNNLLSCEM